MQQLVCKSEEIHTTLRKHLAKEEEQLFPLLLRHFSHAEQVRIRQKSFVTADESSASIMFD